ncbi:hypothetical protein [Xiamenia xianingshaonis]|uniref:hypothetical protein n=1 Tax=Xiamenia xianingshaonis TaxID=2682776 RepID=UPI0021BD4276|nr:hypothetical protein [Xiamenia xianingshaonis]
MQDDVHGAVPQVPRLALQLALPGLRGKALPEAVRYRPRSKSADGGKSPQMPRAALEGRRWSDFQMLDAADRDNAVEMDAVVGRVGVDRQRAPRQPSKAACSPREKLSCSLSIPAKGPPAWHSLERAAPPQPGASPIRIERVQVKERQARPGN